MWEKEGRRDNPTASFPDGGHTYHKELTGLHSVNSEGFVDEDQGDMDEGLDTRYYETQKFEGNGSFITDESIRILKTIADNSKADWPDKLHVLIDCEMEEVALTIHQLSKSTLMCYFTDGTPLLPKFRLWVEEVMIQEMHWPI